MKNLVKVIAVVVMLAFASCSKEDVNNEGYEVTVTDKQDYLATYSPDAVIDIVKGIDTKYPDTFLLDATGSNDGKGGKYLTYEWIIDGKVVAERSSDNAVLNYRFENGRYNIRLIVRNKDGESNYVKVKFIVY